MPASATKEWKNVCFSTVIIPTPDPKAKSLHKTLRSTAKHIGEKIHGLLHILYFYMVEQGGMEGVFFGFIFTIIK